MQRLIVVLWMLSWIPQAQSASSSSVIANSMKYRNPKLDKLAALRKNKGGNDGDLGADEEAGRSLDDDD